MNTNPLLLAAMCFICTWAGFAMHSFTKMFDLSEVFDLHLAAIEPERMPLRQHVRNNAGIFYNNEDYT